MSEKFKFNYPLSPEIKTADSQMLLLEKEKIKKDKSYWSCLDGISVEGLAEKVDLTMMSPPKARKLFLARYEELRP